MGIIRPKNFAVKNCSCARRGRRRVATIRVREAAMRLIEAFRRPLLESLEATSRFLAPPRG